MKRSQTQKLTLGALFVALGIVLPFFTGQIPSIGSKLLPMHLPVILSGFVCGGPIGLIVGALTPILRSMLFGMPPMMPTAVCMAFELATYGFVSGYLFEKLPKKNSSIFASLVIAMLVGRVVWGIVSFVIYGAMGNAFMMKMFIAGAFLNAIPGIILQLILIPIIVYSLQKAKLI